MSPGFAWLLTLLVLAASTSSGATCAGTDPCRACVDCSVCWYCSPRNPKSGSCGTIRNQDSTASKKRIEKQRKRGVF